MPNSKILSWAQSHDGSTFWVSVDISAVNAAPRTKHWHSQTSSNRIRRLQLKLSIAQNPYIPFYLFSEVPMQWLSVLPIEPKVRPESSAFVSKLWTQHPVVYHHVTLSNVSKLPLFHHFSNVVLSILTFHLKFEMFSRQTHGFYRSKMVPIPSRWPWCIVDCRGLNVPISALISCRASARHEGRGVQRRSAAWRRQKSETGHRGIWSCHSWWFQA